MPRDVYYHRSLYQAEVLTVNFKTVTFNIKGIYDEERIGINCYVHRHQKDLLQGTSPVNKPFL